MNVKSVTREGRFQVEYEMSNGETSAFRALEPAAQLFGASLALLSACRAALAYDVAIQKHARDGQVDLRQDGSGIATGDDLDALYGAWIDAARAAVALATGRPAKVEHLPPREPHQLALTMVGEHRISTVDVAAITGMRPGFTLDGRNRYETMVFHGDDSSDLDQDRYATEEQARAGHDAMVAKWLAKGTTESSACKRERWCCLQVGHDGACSPAMLPDGSVIS